MIYRVKRTDTYRSIGAQFGQTDEILIAAELAAANPYRACLLDGLPTLLGGLRSGEALNLPKMWDLDTPRAWGTMREGASECSHNGDWGAAVMDRGIRIPERGLSLEMRQPPAAPAMSLEERGISGVPQTLAAAHADGSGPGGGAGPTTYIPEAWDLVNGTYTIQPGDNIDQIAYFAGVQNPGDAGSAPGKSYIHYINEINGFLDDPGKNPAESGAGVVLKIPPAGIKNIIALDCPDGYQRSPDGKNCQKIPAGQPPKKTPALAIGDTGSMWLLVGGVLVALGVGVAVAKAKKTRKAA